MLSNCYNQLGNPAKATSYYDQLRAADLSAPAELVQAAAEGRWAEALAIARRTRNKCLGEAREVTVLAYEVHALAALQEIGPLRDASRLLLFERAVSPGLEPAVSADVHHDTRQAMLRAFGLLNP
jgi:hypothetical protein